MNTRSFTFALILAGLAMLLVHTYIEDQKANLISKYGTPVTIVRAIVDIKELELIDSTKVAATVVPRKFLPPGGIKSVKEIENTVATVPIQKGEYITKPRITYPGTRTGLARQISVGKRAMAITISDQEAVSKLIKPGDRVDVLAAIEFAPGRKDKQKVQTVLQDVIVLSTGFNITNSIPIMGIKTPEVIKKMNLNTYTKYNTITLELTPNEVQKLTYLLTFGNARPFLSLRNNNDRGQVKTGSTRIFEILNPEDRQDAKQYFHQKYQKKRR